MKVFELLQAVLLEARDWTAIALASAIVNIKKEADVEVTIDEGEVTFTAPAGEDLSRMLKTQMKPFIFRVEYKQEGDIHSYHYYLSRPLIRAEITRIKRSI
jgi:hypothetical protein